MKTFWERWWICNQIRRFCTLKDGIVWVEEREFIEYIKDTVINRKKKLDGGITNAIRFPYGFIGGIKSDLILDSKIRNLLLECSEEDDGVGLLRREPEKKGSGTFHIRLTSIGRERSGSSYPIFGTDYGKNIWTAVIAGVLIWFLTARIQDTKTQIIYVNGQAKTEIPQSPRL